jgi:carboxylesterase type B
MKVFLFILFLMFQTLVFSKFVSVSTQNGQVLGKIINGHREFLGIPYAEKPERFRPPVSKRPWSPRVHNATTFGNFL